jgi:hypothetical protein
MPKSASAGVNCEWKRFELPCRIIASVGAVVKLVCRQPRPSAFVNCLAVMLGKSPLPPDSVNTEFVQEIDRHTVCPWNATASS